MLKQDSYIDSKYVILNGTLLSVKDNAENVVIPSEVNGHRIRRLGAGIHSGNDVKAVIISEGITEIGENAFNNSRSLETVVLPASLKSLGMNSFDSVKRNLKPKKIFLKRAFSRRDFDYILSNSIPLYEGNIRLLNQGHINMPEFSDFYIGLGMYEPARFVDKDMQSLFLTQETSLEGVRQKVEEIPFTGTPRITLGAASQEQDFRLRYARLLRSTMPRTPYDIKSEAHYDRMLQTEAKPSPSFVILTYFDARDVKEEQGKLFVTFELKMGYVFFGNLTRVIYRGRDYYVYRENYLNPTKIGYDYTILDNMSYILDSRGEIPPEDIRTAVIVKYKLPHMLS